MKIFVCCLCAALLSSAFAVAKFEENTVKNIENNKATDKSSDAKPKRDASLLAGSYHGPSFKYLPPSSVYSPYDSYAKNVGPYTVIPGFHSSGIESGQVHGNFAHGQHNGGSAYGLSHISKNNYHSSGHHGLSHISNNFAGHGFVPQINSVKGGISSLSSRPFGHREHSGGHINSYGLGHGYRTSDNGYNPYYHSISGGHKDTPTVFGGEYHYSNGVSGNFPPSASKGFSSGHSLSSSQGLGLPEVHHSDHVHNGEQGHVYIIPTRQPNFGSGHHEVGELPSNAYVPPVKQYHIPSSNYGVPIINAGDTYNKKYHQYTSAAVDQGPSYAAGHKGLGHFSFTANKPSLKQPSYSKAPFKPSTFLGVKYEGNSNEDFPYQQYNPSSAIVGNPTGYDYPAPHDNIATYQQENYPQYLEVQTASKSENDSTYLPPSNNESAFNEIASPNGNHLPTPTNSYDVSYSS